MDREFTFQGTVELRGAEFIVTAKDENDAKLKAMRGEWDHYDLALSECITADVDVTTCQERE